MDKKKLLMNIQGIIDIALLSDQITVSGNDNELADIMIYSSDEKSEYLAFNGRPIIPCSVIKNLVYRVAGGNGTDNSLFRYDHPHLRMEFLLRSDAIIIAEVTDKLIYWFSYGGREYTESVDKSIGAYLADTSIVWVEQLIQSLSRISEPNQDSEKCIDRINEFLRGCSFCEEEDKELLFEYAFVALSNRKRLSPAFPVSLIIQNGLENAFLAYVQNRHINSGENIINDEELIHASANAIRYIEILKANG